MGIKVCKFGGTSMADAKAIRQVESIVRRIKTADTSWYPRRESVSRTISR